MAKIYVITAFNISHMLDRQEIRQMFEYFGNVERILHLPIDEQSCMAVIEMTQECAALMAYNTLNKKIWSGLVLEMDLMEFETADKKLEILCCQR